MAEINATQINVGDAKSQVQNTTDAAKNEAKGAVDSAKAQAQAKANEAKDKAKAAADAAKSKAKEALDAAKAQAMGKLGPILGAVAGIKEGLKKLKKPIPKTPAVKKFEPKKPPTPQKFEAKKSTVDYNKQEQPKPTPKPAAPQGNLAYKYEFNGKRISVGFYQGTTYVDAIGAISFSGKVTEQRAVDSFIEQYKNQYPDLVSKGIQKLS